ncbi:DUF4314 domain-containing protein [Novipirellula sp. SH528]|uniref:DUF4314 domain-containing protein n=1 Tax=Novipirellula sp. SH528 TaxID=3454466 RepID=UPI003FA0D788
MNIPIPGDRIRLLTMPDDPDPVPIGTTGTVRAISHVSSRPAFTQIGVDWDNGRRLMLTVPPDRFEITA